jgi:hypothetical protein
MFARILKRFVSAIVLVALGLASMGPFLSVHAQVDNQSEEIVNLIANFQLYGEVQRFGLGYGEMELHFGVNGPAASLGKMEFIPGGSFQGSGVFSNLQLPHDGTTVINKTFSVPFTMEIDKPASLYMGIGDDGSGHFGQSGNVQVIFDFSDNLSFGGTILGFTRDQGFKLISVTMADGTPLTDNNLQLSFEPASTTLTAGLSAFDAQGAGPVTNSVLANSPAKRAFLMLNKATASSKILGGPDIGGAPTEALVDLDLVQEPDPYVWDIGYAVVSGTDNIILRRINPVSPAAVDAGPDQIGDEGSQFNLHAISSDAQAGTLTYAWDLDGDGTFETPGRDVSFTASDGPATRTVTVRATNATGQTAIDSTTITINNVTPQASFLTPGTGNEGSSLTLSLADPVDPGELDTATGFQYAFDCGDGRGYGAFSSSNNAACPTADNGMRVLKGIIQDKDGGRTEYVSSADVANVSPTASYAVSADTLNEGQDTIINFTNIFDPSSVDTTAGFAYAFDCIGLGIFAPPVARPSYTCHYEDNGSFLAKGRVQDKDGGYNDYTTTILVNNVPPTVGSIAGPVDPVAVGKTISTMAQFTDPGVLDTHTATWDWGDGTGSSAVVTESNGSGSATGTHAYSAAGIYQIKLTVDDKDGGSGENTSQFVVVYDPAAGFVTGGGWIDSPLGAYTVDPTLAGKANFGFVAKYQKGANLPTGNTEFQFHAGGLNFHSSSYQWLVVAGAKAQYKGTGTINGDGNYGFILTAIDSGISRSTTVDLFRIKIWNSATGFILYDNQLGEDEKVDPTTTISGGNIVIHK